MRVKIAEDLDGAEAGAKQAGQNAQQRGFARAVFSDQDVAAARFQVHTHLAKSGKGSEELGDLVKTGREGTGRNGASAEGGLRGLGCGGGHSIN